MRIAIILTIVATLVALGATLAVASGKDLDAQRQVKTPGQFAALDEGGGFRAQGIDVIGQGTVRLSGSNRYETSVAISEGMGWDLTNTITVYVASGEGYADALSLGPSTQLDGPLLLVGRNSLPSVIRAELDYLRPCQVVAVGGTGAISDSVLRQVDGYSDPSLCGW